MNNPQIKYIEYDNIDLQKWDNCITNSQNGIAYAYSWYLDRICEHWDALIFGDYMYVMPLVNSKKYGFEYIYQPFFTQQLGIFSPFPVDADLSNSFLKAIPKKFRLIESKLNLENFPTTDLFEYSEGVTYHLNLNQDIDSIRSNFHKNTLRNIGKAAKNNLLITNLYNIDEFIAFTKANLQEKSTEVKTSNYQNIKKLIGFAIYHQLGELLGVFNAHNQLIASVFFIKANKKVIYLAASSSKEGTEQKAMFLLLDKFIESNENQELTLDFEGSLIPGVARFYEGFGAERKTFKSIKRNTLPWYIKLIKG